MIALWDIVWSLEEYLVILCCDFRIWRQSLQLEIYWNATIDGECRATGIMGQFCRDKS